ncbi:CbbQ/NirQ/NorQ C-terminal domain-containing protein [Methylophaga nitratireducenticrescens]
MCLLSAAIIEPLSDEEETVDALMEVVKAKIQITS